PRHLPLFPYTTLFRSARALVLLPRLSKAGRSARLPGIRTAVLSRSRLASDVCRTAAAASVLYADGAPGIGSRRVWLARARRRDRDRKSTRLNSSHVSI